MISPSQQDQNDRRRATGEQGFALRTAEAALWRIQRCAEAALDDHITPGEAVEQILDELAARSTLGRVRRALGRAPHPSH